MRRSAWTALLLAALMDVGCGGYGNGGNGVSIAITPANATVATGSTLALTAMGNLPKYTNVVWTVENSGLGCTTNMTPPPPMLPGSCPSGWLFVPDSVGNIAQTSATYHAPASPGVFHVHAHAELLPSTADATVTITVTSP